MTTSSHKNYNIHALRGSNISDEEVVAEGNLDPSLVGTPRINDAMLDKMEAENIEWYINNDNMTPQAANAKAKRQRNAVEGDIKSTMASRGMLK